jgi:diacylglycerol kinase (ATP)
MPARKIIFIRNPFSGKAKKLDLDSMIQTYLPSEEFDCELWETSGPEDIAPMVKKAIGMGVDTVVSCGGDGTLNAVSNFLKGSDVTLGIVPLGSGNGLARHLGIPLKTKKAIRFLATADPITVDTAEINGHHFMNIAGIGFDGLISKKFSGVKKRGLKGYAKVISKELSFKTYDFEIETAQGKWKGNAPMVSFTNGSQWGNNVKANPSADLQDGVMEAVIFNARNWLSLGFGILTKKAIKSGKAIMLKGREFEVKSDCPFYHIDGEPITNDKGTYSIKLNEQSLNVLA